MALSERALLEDEAKLDNILHKILVCSEKIDIVADEINNRTVQEKLTLLSATIKNLATLADEITLHEEKITEEMEGKVKEELNSAISNIKEVEDWFTDPDE